MNHSSLYNTSIEKTFDDDQAEILSFLKEELSIKPKLLVRLINYYKGMPVSYPATIIEIDKGRIDLDVSPHQAVIMADCHYTFIRYEGLKHDVCANVSFTDFRRLSAYLNSFFYVEIMAERRGYIRLELDHPLEAILTTNEGIVRGNLKELSYNGAAIIIDHPFALEIDEDLFLKFMLHNSKQNLSYDINVPARLICVNEDTSEKYYRFVTSPDKLLERQIAQFIFQRQVEIIQEIKVVTDKIVDRLPRGKLDK
jgi:hypothetical protein